MNWIKITFIAYAAVLTIGCGDDAEDNNLVGTWNISQYTLDCPAAPEENFNITGSNGCYVYDGSTYCFVINLRADGTGTITVSADDERDMTEVTYTSTSSVLTLCDATSECETFQLDGSTITAVYEDGGCMESYIFSKN